MVIAQFINEEFLKDYTPLTQNVDVKEYLPFVDIAMDIYIQDKIGSKLYTRLQAGIIAGDLNNDETNLLILIRQSLAFYVLYEAIPFLANKLRNIGIVETADTKQHNADRADRKELRQELLNKAEYYIQRVNDYLCKNGKLFPEYVSPDCPISPNHSSSYTCDLDLSDIHVDKNWIRKYYL